MYTLLIVTMVFMAVLTSLKLSSAKVVQLRLCRNKTIMLAFIVLLVVYIVYYASLWLQVMDYKGSYEKRVKSYPSSQ